MSATQDAAVLEEQRINRLFGFYLYIFPSLLLGIGLARTIWRAVCNSKIGFSIDAESQAPVIRQTYPPSALSNAFKRYVMYPALFGGRHRQPIGWYTFPTRMETILVASYWLINIIFLVAHRGVGTERVDNAKLIADRSGVLSLWNMPIFFLLAGRNDFLVWLTGWPYGTFHVFHKWVARVSALMGMVHSIAYAVYMYQIGDEARRWNPAYWWNGVCAMIVMGLILCLSVFPFRKKAYEFFLFCHILGVIMFLSFLYYHLKLSATRAYHPWIWACISMWAFDRFTRLLRLLILNYGAFSKDPRNHHLVRAKFVKGTDVIQLTVYPSAQDVGYFPGAHYFIFLGGTWRFWECHPFTAAGWRSSGPVLTTMPELGGVGIKRSLQGSLKNSLREPKLPPRAKTPRAKTVSEKSSRSRGASSIHLALKELEGLKEIPAEPKDPAVAKEKRQGKHIYIVKQSGTKDIYITSNTGKKELGSGTQTPVTGSLSRQSSTKSKKEMAKGKEMQRTRSGRGRKASHGSESSESTRGTSTRGTSTEREAQRSRGSSTERDAQLSESEKLNESEMSESGKFSFTTAEFEKAYPSGEEESNTEYSGGEEIMTVQEKVLSVVIEVEEGAEYDEFVQIDQNAMSSIASTTRKGAPRPKLIFFIKPRRGMTATLAQRIREHEEQNKIRGFPRGRELEIKCLIEGAYGVNHPLHLFETVVLIAGGVGITTILPYLVDYMERDREPERNTLTRRLVFLWTAKEEELVEDLVAKKFPKGCLTRTDISMQLYVTRSNDKQKKLPGVRYRRPKIPDILKSEQKRLVGRMAVMSCGPSVLVDIVRDSVVGCLDAERKHVEYFEESY